MSSTISRADKYTQTQKIGDVYSDFDITFQPHPITGDLVRVRNEQSVKQALRNLIMTSYYERPFQPTVGCNTKLILFEPNDAVAAQDLQYHIQQTINNWETRVTLLAVNVQSYPDNDSIVISITFSLINTQTAQTVSVILNRVR